MESKVTSDKTSDKLPPSDWCEDGLGMAGDWIKMRASLMTHPKVIAMAKQIESDKSVGKFLSTGFGGALREIVTRNVTRDVTLASLFRVWCAANEHTSDGVWHGIELDDLDHVAGIPGFGAMMEIVGWAVFDEDNKTVTFPNFLEYNAPAKEGRDKGAAERQRRYREKHRQSNNESDVTRNVTSRATLRATSNVEKRREEKSINSLSHGEIVLPKDFDTDDFLDCWKRWKRHLVEKQKTLTPTTEQHQLMELSRYGPAEAIAIVGYAIEKGASNLILDGSHKRETRTQTNFNKPSKQRIEI